MSKSLELRDVLTPSQPLGPPFTEPLLKSPHKVFKQLYDRSNGFHGTAERDDPVYIVGRKGSGKTAFLVGTAFMNRAEIILIKSEDVYQEVERLRKRYASEISPMFSDNLAHVWDVLLTHAAMLLAHNVKRFKALPERRVISDYLSSYGNPTELQPDTLLARVGSALSDCLVAAPRGMTISEACSSLRRDVGCYSRAREALVELASARVSLYVMVDNLEDLHFHIEDLAVTLAALFRSTREHANSNRDGLPFNVRFAFPAELLPNLRNLTSNPEKDFLDYMVITWTAPELITLSGNRLRAYLDLHHPNMPARLGLPRIHDPRDPDEAERTLRALLPQQEIRTGLAPAEDPVAYVMRHTQLLPRHLIQILNEILKRGSRGRDGLLRATREDVLQGVKQAELRIVEGVLSSYRYDHPYMADALALLRNHVSNTMRCSELHRRFNTTGVAKLGLTFSEFMEAALAVGALGVVEGRTDRYTIGRFSYTTSGGLSPIEDLDSVCFHPLFMYRLFDPGGLRRLRQEEAKPVYPYGSDRSHRHNDW